VKNRTLAKGRELKEENRIIEQGTQEKKQEDGPREAKRKRKKVFLQGDRKTGKKITHWKKESFTKKRKKGFEKTVYQTSA